MSNRVITADNNFQLTRGNFTSASAEIAIKDATVSTYVRRNYCSRYNFFIKTYNYDCNRIENKYLSYLTTSTCARTCSCRICCLIILGLFPFVSIPILFIAICRLVVFCRIISIVRHNRRLVPNPFERMVYCPDLKNYTNAFYDISSRINYQELSYLGLSASQFDAAILRYKDGIIEGRTIRVMFYKDEFKNYERNVITYICPKIYFTSFLLIASVIGTSITISTALVIYQNHS